ncbi:hypothetical protein MLD52_00365 [Puniceicoccaceae bacterium K14]|nr:hypothetical protein [Puniceicoccaceae bacterium K14]
MITLLLSAYAVALVVGSWLMLVGIEQAPVAYENQDGFHYGTDPEEDSYY